MAEYCPFLIIFRGDDTNHELNKSIRFVMTDSGYSLDGMTLHFSFLGTDKTFTDFDPERSCELAFTAEETKQFPVGISYATLYLIDAEGKRHTLTTTLPVKVTLNAEEAYNGLDIPVRFPMWNIGMYDMSRLRSDVDRLIEAYNKAMEKKESSGEIASEISGLTEDQIRNMTHDEQSELLITLQKYILEDSK